jgi:hypothetical protein
MIKRRVSMIDKSARLSLINKIILIIKIQTIGFPKIIST